MPFKSKAQARKFRAMEAAGEIPEGTSSRWAKHTPSIKALPEKVEADKTEKEAACLKLASLLGIRTKVREKSAARKDNHADVVDWLKAMNHHPESCNAGMSGTAVPYKVLMKSPEEINEDAAAIRERHKRTFKVAFLTECLDRGLGIEEMHQAVRESLQKKAGVLSSIMGSLGTLGTVGLVGAPVVAGAGLGLAAAKMKRDASKNELDELKRTEMAYDYRRLAEQLRRSTILDRVANTNPGSIASLKV